MSEQSDQYGMTDYEFRMTKGLMYDEAFSGDQSFAINAVSYLHYLIEKNRVLDDLDQAALLLIIERIRENSQAMNVVCGVEQKPGRNKRGTISLNAALAVHKRIRAEGLTAEEAWELTSEEVNLSSSTVKKYWMKWKKELDWMAHCGITAHLASTESQNDSKSNNDFEEPNDQGPTKP